MGQWVTGYEFFEQRPKPAPGSRSVTAFGMKEGPYFLRPWLHPGRSSEIPSAKLEQKELLLPVSIANWPRRVP